MIVALEGPCFSGKSTLFRNLVDNAHKIERLRRHLHWYQFPKRKWSLAEYSCDPLFVQAFAMLYDSTDDLVICDRIWPVTSVIYGRLREETFDPIVLAPPWLPDLHVVHLLGIKDVPETKGYFVRMRELEELHVPTIQVPYIDISARTQLVIDQIKQWSL